MARGFGVDIGGSGIKGCPVDLDKGELIGSRVRIETPQPSLPDAVCDVVAQVVGQLVPRVRAEHGQLQLRLGEPLTQPAQIVGRVVLDDQCGAHVFRG